MVRVLYVEDETNLAKIVTEILINRNYDVRLVQRGDLALAAYREFNPDICVCSM